MAEINTFSMHKIDPCNPSKQSVFIDDIAHALSMIARSGGHFPTFYSVARHSIMCFLEAKAREYSARVCLFCLLHDASEAYLQDVTSPVKKNLPQYLAYERNLQEMIFKKFCCACPDETEQKLVSFVDNDMLLNEFHTIMNLDLEKTIPGLKVEIDPEFYGFEKDEKMFLKCFVNAQKAVALESLTNGD